MGKPTAYILLYGDICATYYTYIGGLWAMLTRPKIWRLNIN